MDPHDLQPWLERSDPPDWAFAAAFPEGDDVVVLPEVIEKGTGIYRAEVDSLVKFIRHEGGRARFLHEKESRSYRVLLGETDLPFLLSVVASLVASASWDLVTAGVRQWLINSEAHTVRLKVHVRKSSGDEAWFKASGDAKEVVEALSHLGEILRNDIGDSDDD